ncbi:MAG: hypothetical protein G01um10145_949 [Microgenomates group bacterium Gr01-1014_5]|nr:MAG: hypothetical protein G01um10145_949 [Microgenomates group bacterium Gr01-1014_5]
MPLNGWLHAVFTYDGANIKGYANGVLEVTTPSTGSITANAVNLWLGRYNSSTTKYFPGRIDDVRLYNRALTPAEVSQLYAFAPGPVGYWDMEEGTGIATVDKSGNGLGGTITNATWTTAKYGNGLKFDGSGDYVTVSDTTTLEPQAITVSAWVKTTQSGTNFVGIVDKYTGSTAGYLLDFPSGTDMFPRLTVRTSADQTVTATVATNDGNWHYIAATYDGANCLIYIDGKLNNTAACTGTATYDAHAVIIGGDGVSTNYLNGSIDEVKIYSYARTAKQIVQDMNAGHPSVGSPVGSPVSYWKFDENYSTTAYDSIGNANNLTLSSASWTGHGQYNTAWDGDGGKWLSRADDADFDFAAAEDLSISFWFKSGSALNPGATEYLINKASAIIAGYGVYANTSGQICFGIDDDTSWGPDVASCTSADVYDNTWHFVTAVRNTTLDNLYLYSDAVQADSDNDTTTATLANSLLLYVGDRDGTDNGDEFTGDIDELKIYRFALTASEVKLDMNRGSAQVLGALSDNSTYQKQAVNQEYCIPGDTATCSAPVGRWKLEESATPSYDTSDNENSGTWAGNTTVIAGQNGVGKGAYFDGTGDWIELGTSSIFSLGAGNFTLCAWSKSTGSEEDIVANGVSSNGNYLLMSSNNFFKGHVWYSGNSNALSGTKSVVDGNWHYGCQVVDATKIYIYTDGVLDASAALVGTKVGLTGAGVIGSRTAASASNNFLGSIDDVRIYSYARTGAQVAWDYNRGKPVGHWKFDECQGTTANDSSGNSNSGTISIGATGTYTSAGTCASGTSTHAWAGGSAGAGKRNYVLSLDGTCNQRSSHNSHASQWLATRSIYL